jgi:hypothetical protein
MKKAIAMEPVEANFRLVEDVGQIVDKIPVACLAPTKGQISASRSGPYQNSTHR